MVKLAVVLTARAATDRVAQVKVAAKDMDVPIEARLVELWLTESEKVALTSAMTIRVP